MTTAVPTEPAHALSRHERRRQARATLSRVGQGHVLAAWDRLSAAEQDSLLEEIARVDWELVDRLYHELVREQRPPFRLPDVPWEPAPPDVPDERALTTGLEVLRAKGESPFAILVMAGGTGSRLRFPHAKGLFPATPLSGTPLYQIMVDKSKAAARAFGHERMFPMIFMLSDDTAEETRAYFEANDWFGEADRILLVRQEVLPLLDRRPGHEGLVVMLSGHQMAMGGAGHGDALDVVLTRDPVALSWLGNLGVRYVQLANVDNPLSPVADPTLLGMHVRSQSPDFPGRAHISVILIPKSATPRLGNVIQYRESGEYGRVLQHSIDYGILAAVDDRCSLGHANMQMVTLASLPGSTPIPFIVAEKEISVGGERIPIWKFERSSVNKERYGALLRREHEEVFAPIKQRNEDGEIETPAAAARLQSDHWKRFLPGDGDGDVGPAAPRTSRLELPWDADYLPRAEVEASLRRLGFPRDLLADTGYLVTPGFESVREIPLRRPERKAPRVLDRRMAEANRHRAIVAAFNNAFEHDPDVLVAAPGRNTAIGDHLDYPPLPQDGSASSHTIAWATRENVLVAAGRRPDHGIKLYSLNEQHMFTLSLDDLEGLAGEAAHNNLPDVYGQPLYPWAMSTLALLYSAARGVPGVRTALPLFGAAFAIEGNLPQGAGQSSSAAFLVAITLACNELFGWGIPLSDAFTLADLARSGEHEDYSPFIRKGRAGYLDQIVSLTAREGKAVVIDHGNYAKPEWVDLDAIEAQGYRNVVVLSGLSRSLAETEYLTRVDELSRLPAALNDILARHRPDWTPRTHVHQYSIEEWRQAESDLERHDPVLARRARYVFEERQRCHRFRSALSDGRIDELLDVVNASGEAMSMDGPYQISGYNHVPVNHQRIAALDLLREIVLRRAGPRAAARLIGGGGAGPLYLLAPQEVCDTPDFARGIEAEWRAVTGLDARVAMDPPARGAEVVWRRQAPAVIRQAGQRRIETYPDVQGDLVYRLVDETTGVAVETVPRRGTVRAMTAVIDGAEKAILYNPEIDPAENGACPYLGPWTNRIQDGIAVFDGRRVDLMQVTGVRDDGDGHALHGLMTQGWSVDDSQTRIDAEGVTLVSTIETPDYTDDPGVQELFGPARTVLVHRLHDHRLYIESITTHLGSSGNSHRIPVLAAVHPWLLLHRQRHAYAELMIAADRHRVTWDGAAPRLRNIPLPAIPALPIPSISRNYFRRVRRLGFEEYDVSFAWLTPGPGAPHAVIELRDWFRNVLIHVGVEHGFDEFILYRPGNGQNTVCLEPQIGSVNALGEDAPPDAHIPALRPGESYSTSMYIAASTLSTSGIRSGFAAPIASAWSPWEHGHFPILLASGLEQGPIAHPEKTATQKDSVRVFFAGRWHIYGTGHEMKDVNNPPPGHRPHRGSILFHLVSPAETGPWVEEDPPVLFGRFPPGIYEAPAVVAEGDVLHLYAQTTYYRLGGSIEHFVSRDGHNFAWVGTALQSIKGGAQAGVYDADVCELPDAEGRGRPAMVYSAFRREGSRDDRPDPQIFVAVSEGGWEGPFINGDRPILRDTDVSWHNSHDAGNPYYEWGLEGAQLLPLPDGHILLLSVGFEKRPGRDYMAAQRLFFALYDRRLRLLEVSRPILPLHPGWDEYGHGHMMIDVNNPRLLRLLYQARPANEDRMFRDSNSWRLFEALFDISHLS